MAKLFKIKAKEVASALHISPATVSLALNDKPGVNLETKRRILNYINQAEIDNDDRALYGGTIMLLVYVNPRTPKWPENKNLFSNDYMEFSSMAQKVHMELKLQYVYSDQELNDALEHVPEHILGIIINGDEIPPQSLQLLDRCRVPILAYSCEMAGHGWSAVNFHNAKAVREGLAHLQERGHRDILYLMNTHWIYNFAARRREFVRNFSDTPSFRAESRMIPTGDNLDAMAEAICRCLSANSKLPEAIFSENYMVSIALSMAVQRLGIRIPEDISVIGIDSVPHSVTMAFDLTHFRVPHIFRSHLVGELLMRRMKAHEQPAMEVYLDMELIPGTSVSDR